MFIILKKSYTWIQQHSGDHKEEQNRCHGLISLASRTTGGLLKGQNGHQGSGRDVKVDQMLDGTTI